MFENMKNCMKIACQFLKATFQVSYGSWKLSNLPKPIVSIFGGTNLKPGSDYLYKAHELSNKLVENNISVISGGGPGIMHAANCGAYHEMTSDEHGHTCKGCKKRSGSLRTMGIGIKGIPGEKELNPCVGKELFFDHFFARKQLLINFSCGFVIFPGGFGTMDELSDLLNLMQTNKLATSPVILFDTNYWKDYLAWLRCACKEGLISSKGASLITSTDDVSKVVLILKNHCKLSR